jgi:hypothetical protein
MSIAEAVLEKLNQLSEEKQKQVLRYAESLTKRRQATRPGSFLDTALSLRLAGPPDWSDNLDDYLYGDKKDSI